MFFWKLPKPVRHVNLNASIIFPAQFSSRFDRSRSGRMCASPDQHQPGISFRDCDEIRQMPRTGEEITFLPTFFPGRFVKLYTCNYLTMLRLVIKFYFHCFSQQKQRKTRING